MIELVIAAIVSLSSISADVTTPPVTAEATISSTATTPPATGGTGTWDDNN